MSGITESLESAHISVLHRPQTLTNGAREENDQVGVGGKESEWASGERTRRQKANRDTAWRSETRAARGSMSTGSWTPTAPTPLPWCQPLKHPTPRLPRTCSSLPSAAAGADAGWQTSRWPGRGKSRCGLGLAGLLACRKWARAHIWNKLAQLSQEGASGSLDPFHVITVKLTCTTHRCALFNTLVQ